VHTVPAFLAFGVRVDSGQQSRTMLDSHTDIETPALRPIQCPAQKLPIAQPLLGLGYGPAAYAAQHQFMPELLFVG
jgi:hypothetical protein